MGELRGSVWDRKGRVYECTVIDVESVWSRQGELILTASMRSSSTFFSGPVG